MLTWEPLLTSPPFFPPPKGAKKTEDAQDGQRGGIIPAGTPVMPALAPPSCPLWPLVMPALAPLSCPALPPLSCPQGPHCHSRRLLAGIQCLSLLALIRVTLRGNSHGFPIKNVGNDSG